jgi:2',3'-cyclic-nucleotide 2'-phosphodiesterase (5'-nucleotidase family)
MKRLTLFAFWCALSVSGSMFPAFAEPIVAPEAPVPAAPAAPLEVGEGERLLTLLMTNDIHGGIEPSANKAGKSMGGLAFFGGVVKSIREGLNKRFGDRAGVLVLDAGDQFQGTLISNFDEGRLLYDAMNEVGYDAAVPGNHDYDFGPEGWLDDQVVPGLPDQNLRGAFLKLLPRAKFAVLSANTYRLDSLVDVTGKPVQAANIGCRAIGADGRADAGATPIDWSRAQRVDFLKPYLIRQVAGLRVALIGIDNPSTPEITTPANVRDLCFDDEVQGYLRARAELEGQADVFVMVLHDAANDGKLVRAINKAGRKVDAIIAGHTHMIQRDIIDGVPVIQSSSGGKMFGRIDLVWNSSEKRLDAQKTRAFAGIALFHDQCDPQQPKDGFFCEAKSPRAAPLYEGVPAVENVRILDLVREARKAIAPISDRKLGVAKGQIFVDRISESPLANAMTDALRKLTGVEISFMNSSGIRAPLDSGDFTYEELFKVIPFNNHAVLAGPMPRSTLLQLLTRSIRTCGAYGALMQSGLKVVYERDCTGQTETDAKARLLSVTTLAGEAIYDSEKDGPIASGVSLPQQGSSLERTFQIATLDFLSAGGSGYTELKTVPLLENGDRGILREALTSYYLKEPAMLSSEVDGRWLLKKRAP